MTSELSTLTNIVRIEQEGGIAVFNFTVEGNHNYFILAKEYEYGQTCVLVHNKKLSNYTSWNKGGSNLIEDSLSYHYNKHGKEVGAKNIDEYYQMAKEALDSIGGKKGTPVPGKTPNVISRVRKRPLSDTWMSKTGSATGKS